MILNVDCSAVGLSWSITSNIISGCSPRFIEKSVSMITPYCAPVYSNCINGCPWFGFWFDTIRYCRSRGGGGVKIPIFCRTSGESLIFRIVTLIVSSSFWISFASVLAFSGVEYPM